MATIYLLYPEVAGGLGSKTEILNRLELESGIEKVPKIGCLEYVFDGWLGDSLLTAFPGFIVSESLANDMRSHRLTGFVIEEVDITKSNLFIELHSDKQVPSFKRLMVKGSAISNDDQTVHGWSKHDVCLNQHGDLMVTEQCMKILQKHQLEFCDITEVTLI